MRVMTAIGAALLGVVIWQPATAGFFVKELPNHQVLCEGGWDWDHFEDDIIPGGENDGIHATCVVDRASKDHQKVKRFCITDAGDGSPTPTAS